MTQQKVALVYFAYVIDTDGLAVWSRTHSEPVRLSDWLVRSSRFADGDERHYSAAAFHGTRHNNCRCVYCHTDATAQITLQRDTIDISGKGELTIGELPSGIDNSSLTWVPVRLYPPGDGGLQAPSFASNETYPLCVMGTGTT